MRARLVIGGAAVLAALVPATASAVPPSDVGSCPAERSGWTQMQAQEAAETIFPDLVNQPGFEDFVTEIKGFDVNGDGDVCLATRAQKNERAHWFGYPYFIVKDNNTGTG